MCLPQCHLVSFGMSFEWLIPTQRPGPSLKEDQMLAAIEVQGKHLDIKFMFEFMLLCQAQKLVSIYCFHIRISCFLLSCSRTDWNKYARCTRAHARLVKSIPTVQG
ncbi:hypothetical protein K435DRAFT_789901 [Dendrothele bispora CBS 962.96]|uniref:Uncharacterized protein n=1 Tax=Dendrothele bispora (strain CBS 962.96) TaxID=1314807 RepID=A0A4S8MS86_DENBC|nr:hypothetical protein K435DRAFT_789901 [Dendrothele bispora CBS 962.96]